MGIRAIPTLYSDHLSVQKTSDLASCNSRRASMQPSRWSPMQLCGFVILNPRSVTLFKKKPRLCKRLIVTLALLRGPDCSDTVNSQICTCLIVAEELGKKKKT